MLFIPNLAGAIQAYKTFVRFTAPVDNANSLHLPPHNLITYFRTCIIVWQLHIYFEPIIIVVTVRLLHKIRCFLIQFLITLPDKKIYLTNFR